MKMIKKKLGGGLKFLKILITVLFFCKSLYANQIVDFETEDFIKFLITDIKKVNNIKKKIKV